MCWLSTPGPWVEGVVLPRWVRSAPGHRSRPLCPSGGFRTGALQGVEAASGLRDAGGGGYTSPGSGPSSARFSAASAGHGATRNQASRSPSGHGAGGASCGGRGAFWLYRRGVRVQVRSVKAFPRGSTVPAGLLPAGAPGGTGCSAECPPSWVWKGQEDGNLQHGCSSRDPPARGFCPSA